MRIRPEAVAQACGPASSSHWLIAIVRRSFTITLVCTRWRGLNLAGAVRHGSPSTLVGQEQPQ